MNRIALAIVMLLASSASAGPPPEGGDEVAAAGNKLGFQFGFGRMPVADGDPLAMFTFGLGVEHPVFSRDTRVFAGYEWLWVLAVPQRPRAQTMTFAGAGHRVHLGLRRTLADKRFDAIRFFSDLEVGGGIGMLDAPTGVQVLPHGFVGIRGGYDLRSRSRRGARRFGVAIDVRAIVVGAGVGFGGGFEFAWGS